jgi:hypothetical protein
MPNVTIPPGIGTVTGPASDPRVEPDEWVAAYQLIVESKWTKQTPEPFVIAIFKWDAAIRLFRAVETQRLIAAEPTLEDLKMHEALLHSLISTGLILELSTSDQELESLVIGHEISRQNLIASIQELKDTLSMWHGPEVDPNRKAELEKAIFGVAT